jgi:hypothetical protein
MVVVAAADEVCGVVADAPAAVSWPVVVLEHPAAARTTPVPAMIIAVRCLVIESLPLFVIVDSVPRGTDKFSRYCRRDPDLGSTCGLATLIRLLAGQLCPHFGREPTVVDLRILG